VKSAILIALLLFVTVHGEVRKPSDIPFRSGMTISEAIAEAGGFTRHASATRVVLIRDRRRFTVNLGSEPDMTLRPWDTVVVSQRLVRADSEE
jgi:protein involved in polysaccharide export with SLBB domain